VELGFVIGNDTKAALVIKSNWLAIYKLQQYLRD
jgi:hypothetical protein